MEDPQREITGVIHLLTQSPPSIQQQAIEKYFVSSAEFIHPFCRTGTFDSSRFLIRAIYRWYKILSPRIDLKVNSIAYDAHNLILYVSLWQLFQIWFIPFYRAPVELTTVLKLRKASDDKYYITSQNDLYQTNQFVKFFAWPFGHIFVLAWQFLSTLICVAAATTFWPVSWWEDHGSEIRYEANRDAARVEARLKHTLVDANGSGNFVTAPAISQ